MFPTWSKSLFFFFFFSDFSTNVYGSASAGSSPRRYEVLCFACQFVNFSYDVWKFGTVSSKIENEFMTPMKFVSLLFHLSKEFHSRCDPLRFGTRYRKNIYKWEMRVSDWVRMNVRMRTVTTAKNKWEINIWIWRLYFDLYLRRGNCMLWSLAQSPHSSYMCTYPKRVLGVAHA